jgi:hypothetical protein
VSVTWSNWEEEVHSYREAADMDESELNVVHAEWLAMDGGKVQGNDAGKTVEEYGREENDNWGNYGKADSKIDNDNEDEDEEEGEEDNKGEDDKTDDDDQYGLLPATAYTVVVPDSGNHKRYLFRVEQTTKWQVQNDNDRT